MSKISDIILVFLPAVASMWLDRKADCILVEVLNPGSQGWHHQMPQQSHNPAVRNDGNLKKRVGTRWRGYLYEPTLEPTQVRRLWPLFPQQLAAKARMKVVRIGFRKCFPQMRFHACTHDMLRVGHAGMLGFTNGEELPSVIGNFMDNT